MGILKSENAMFLIDLMSTQPEIANSIIVDTLKQSGVYQEKSRGEIFEMIRTCGKAKTSDGVQACINLSREDISEAFTHTPISSKFNDFLADLDDKIAEAKDDFSVQFIL